MTFGSVLVVFPNSQCIPCSAHQSVKQESAHLVCFGFYEVDRKAYFLHRHVELLLMLPFYRREKAQRYQGDKPKQSKSWYTVSHAAKCCFSQSASSIQTTRLKINNTPSRKPFPYNKKRIRYTVTESNHKGGLSNPILFVTYPQ